jgi:hypothetical protein
MKIMKTLNKRSKNNFNYKYRINLPKELVENSKLIDKEVEIKLENGKIIIQKIE